ncbi:MAG: MopE-related protein [Sorangiineae bacterium]|nr:MopE-related protein [Polyangiaceae bacterium]MEB2323409.1 MopE-related protein [Sorangiineae bacterium]
MTRSLAVISCLSVFACASSVADDTAGSGGGPGSGGADAGANDAAGGASGASGAGATGGGAGTGTWPGMCANGEVAECYTGPAGTKDVGACRHGTHTCVEGEYPPTCDGEVLPAAAEACNGVDDDCDGTVDEGCACSDGQTLPCYVGPAGTEGVGPCKGGVQTCAGGVWGACAGTVLPSAESCNGADDDCNGVIDDKAGLRLYSMPFGGSGWTSQYLSDAWTGPNAPPRCADIMVTEQLTDIGRLLVFTTDGQLYTRANGTWRPPLPAASRFPSLPSNVEGVYQVPSSFNDPAARGATVTFSARPYAYLYDYDQNDVATFGERVEMKDGTSGGGPNQHDWESLWTVGQWSSDGVNDRWFNVYFGYGGGGAGKVYVYHETGGWTSSTTAASALWSGKSNPPPLTGCIDGYADQSPSTAYLVCP